MQLQIQASKPIENKTIDQILKFYSGRFDYQLTSLEIRLESSANPLGHHQYDIHLSVKLLDGDRIELKEIQSDLVYATHRVLDRLVRHLGRLHRTQLSISAY